MLRHRIRVYPRLGPQRPSRGGDLRPAGRGNVVRLNLLPLLVGVVAPLAPPDEEDGGGDGGEDGDTNHDADNDADDVRAA